MTNTKVTAFINGMSGSDREVEAGLIPEQGKAFLRTAVVVKCPKGKKLHTIYPMAWIQADGRYRVDAIERVRNNTRGRVLGWKDSSEQTNSGWTDRWTCTTHTSDGIVTERINVRGFISEVTHCTNCGARIVTPKERPFPISSGAWRVTRDATAIPNGQRIVVAENVTKEYAEIVARNWRAYNAKAEAMQEAPVT